MNKLFYVYELVDPRNGLCFYVGKGNSNRMMSHEASVRNNKIANGNKKLTNKIKKIKSLGFDVLYNQPYNNISEFEAFIKEIELIDFHGLQNLCNLTSGGEGISGYRHTKETKKNIATNKIRNKKISVALKGKKHTPERILINKLSQIGKHNITEEQRQNYIKSANKDHKSNYQWDLEKFEKEIAIKNEFNRKEKISTTLKNHPCTLETKQKIGIANTGENNGMYGKIPWNKGLTKDTDIRIAKYTEVATSTRNKNSKKSAWNKGLTKETDERVAKYGQSHKKNSRKQDGK